MIACITDPLLHIFKRLPCYINIGLESILLLLTCYVVADNSHTRVLNILRYQAMELFLTGSVPHLNTDHLVVHEYVLGEEIDTDGGLYKND